MYRRTFSNSLKEQIVQAFIQSSAPSKIAFYYKELPEIWASNSISTPVPALNTVYRWLEGKNANVEQVLPQPNPHDV